MKVLETIKPAMKAKQIMMEFAIERTWKHDEGEFVIKAGLSKIALKEANYIAVGRSGCTLRWCTVWWCDLSVSWTYICGFLLNLVHSVFCATSRLQSDFKSGFGGSDIVVGIEGPTLSEGCRQFLSVHRNVIWEVPCKAMRSVMLHGLKVHCHKNLSSKMCMLLYTEATKRFELHCCACGNVAIVLPWHETGQRDHNQQLTCLTHPPKTSPTSHLFGTKHT